MITEGLSKKHAFCLEETASSYGGKLRKYCVSSHGQPTRGVLIAWELGWELRALIAKIQHFNKILVRTSDLACCFEHGNEPLGSLKGEEFVDWLSIY